MKSFSYARSILSFEDWVRIESGLQNGIYLFNLDELELLITLIKDFDGKHFVIK